MSLRVLSVEKVIVLFKTSSKKKLSWFLLVLLLTVALLVYVEAATGYCRASERDRGSFTESYAFASVGVYNDAIVYGRVTDFTAGDGVDACARFVAEFDGYIRDIEWKCIPDGSSGSYSYSYIAYEYAKVDVRGYYYRELDSLAIAKAFWANFCPTSIGVEP